MAGLDPSDVCVCTHERDLHQGTGTACVGIVVVHGREQYCPCTVFDLDEEVGPCGSWR